MNRIIFAVLILVIVAITAGLTFHRMEKQQKKLHEIETHISKQDSVVATLTNVNKNLHITIHKQDSIMDHQQELIRNYEKAIDSLNVIMRFLQRSDLQDRYRSKPD